MDENPGRSSCTSTAAIPNPFRVDDGAAAGAPGAAQAARGTRISLHRRTPDPARHPRPHHRRLSSTTRFRTRHGARSCMRRVAASLGLSVALLWLARCRRHQDVDSPGRRSGRRPRQAPPESSSRTARTRSSSPCSATSAPASASSTSSARRWRKVHERFPYELVITVGDNLYGSRAAAGFREEVRRCPTSRCSTPA